jgi:hypothetical protein
MKEKEKKQQQDDPRPPLGQRDAQILIIAARAFRKCAQPFIEKLTASYNPKFPDAPWDADIGECIASATNLALSVELYLKALWLLTGTPHPNTHNLRELYDPLPPVLKTDLEAFYDAIPKSQDVPGSFHIVATPFGHALPRPEEMAAKGPKLDLSLPAVLAGSSDAFITWRYFHEVLRPDRPTPIDYPFGSLAQVADMLDARAVRGLREIAEDAAAKLLAAARKAEGGPGGP